MNPLYRRIIGAALAGGLLGSAYSAYLNLRGDTRLNALLTRRRRFNRQMVQDILAEKQEKKKQEEKTEDKGQTKEAQLRHWPLYAAFLAGFAPVGFLITHRILSNLRSKRFKKELKRTSKVYDAYLKNQFGVDTDVDELVEKSAGDRYAELMDPNSSEAAEYLHKVAEEIVDSGMHKHAINPVDLMVATALGLGIPFGVIAYRMTSTPSPALYAEDLDDLEKRIRKIREGEKIEDEEKPSRRRRMSMYYFPGRGISTGIPLM